MITFSYAKYFVQSYTVDVVFTLSSMVCLFLPQPVNMKFKIEKESL